MVNSWLCTIDEIRDNGKKLPFFTTVTKNTKLFIAFTVTYFLLSLVYDCFVFRYGAWNFMLYVVAIVVMIYVVFLSKIIMKDFLKLVGSGSTKGIYVSMASIFRDQKDYEWFFKNKIQKVLFPQRDIRYGSLLWFFVLIIILYTLPMSFKENLLSTFGQFAFGSYLGVPLILNLFWWILNICYWYFFWILLFSIMRFIVNSIRILNALKRNTDKLSIIDTINFLKKSRRALLSNLNDEYSEFLGRGEYSVFLKFSDAVSSYLSKISITIITITIIIYNTFIIFYREYPFVQTTICPISIIVYDLIAIIFGLILFIYPQIFTFQVLKSYKDTILHLLESIYEISLLKYISAKSIHEKKQSLDLIEKLEVTMDYVNHIRTLPFGLLQLVKTLSIILIWLQFGMLSIIQFILGS